MQRTVGNSLEIWIPSNTSVKYGFVPLRHCPTLHAVLRWTSLFPIMFKICEFSCRTDSFNNSCFLDLLKSGIYCLNKLYLIHPTCYLRHDCVLRFATVYCLSQLLRLLFSCLRVHVNHLSSPTVVPFYDAASNSLNLSATSKHVTLSNVFSKMLPLSKRSGAALCRAYEIVKVCSFWLVTSGMSAIILC